jgi:hypothetical protein
VEEFQIYQIVHHFKRKQRDPGFMVNSNCINSAQTLQRLHEIPIPRSIKEALSSPYADKWKEAINSELTSLNDNNTWILVDAPKDNRHVIGSMWVFAVKYNQSDGSVERFKARLVARGDSKLPE